MTTFGVFFRATAALVGVASLVASGVAWCDGIWWVGALVRPWIAPFAVAQALVGAAILSTRRRAFGCAVLGAAALHGGDVWLSMRDDRPVADAATTAHEIKLVVVNIAFFNADASGAAAWILSEDPDVAVVLETNAAHAAKLKPLTARTPYVATVHSDHDAGGLTLYAKAPIEDVVVFRPGGSLPQVSASIKFEAAPFRLYAVHAMPPLNASCAAVNDAAILEIGARVAADVEVGNAVVVAGDFNAAPWSPRLLALETTAGLVHGRRGRGLLNTWPEWRPIDWIGMPVDHVLTGGGARVADLRRGPPIGSDHRGLVAVVRLP